MRGRHGAGQHNYQEMDHTPEGLTELSTKGANSTVDDMDDRASLHSGSQGHGSRQPSLGEAPNEQPAQRRQGAVGSRRGSGRTRPGWSAVQAAILTGVKSHRGLCESGPSTFCAVRARFVGR